MVIESKARWRVLLRRAKDGDDNAQYLSGLYYDEGVQDSKGKVVVQKNIRSALKWYTLSAHQGNEASQIALGNLYSSGDRVGKDIERAIFWTKKAIAQGSACAASNLGAIYRDCNKPRLSYRWYAKAVEMGDLDALLQLSICHMIGYGTKKDAKAALTCTEILLSNGHAPENVCQQTIENAYFWQGLLQLLQGQLRQESIEHARSSLLLALEHEAEDQSYVLLNVLGRNGTLG